MSRHAPENLFMHPSVGERPHHQQVRLLLPGALQQWQRQPQGPSPSVLPFQATRIRPALNAVVWI